jgi:hypothetical protein
VNPVIYIAASGGPFQSAPERIAADFEPAAEGSEFRKDGVASCAGLAGLTGERRQRADGANAGDEHRRRDAEKHRENEREGRGFENTPRIAALLLTEAR